LWNDAGIVRRLRKYLLRYRWRYAVGGACLLGTASLAMLVPYLLKMAVDAIQHEQPLATIAQIALGIIAVAIVQGVVRTFSRFIVFNV